MRQFSRRSRARRTRAVLAVVAAVALLGLAPSAFASHGVQTLVGSNFEIDNDANLKVDDAGNLDWANVVETRKTDTASGPTDESFGNGTKEDTAVPSVVDGSIPPNKSDLKAFGVYQEGSTSNGFLNLFWTRVQDPSGTTNMDFEFNQSKTASANGVTPVRTAGDLLITYDLSRGGTHPTLSIRKWTGSAWGDPKLLADSTEAAGSINSTGIAAGDSDGLGSLDPRTFGEAQIDLKTIFTDPTICQSFGSAYLKSRSSDSFTAALKDFVPPVAVNLSNCGSVEITKKDDAGNLLSDAEFTLYKDNAPTGGSRGSEDTATTLTCKTVSGVCTIANVLQGEYWVVETKTPAGYDTADDQHISVPADSKVSVTFVDPRQRGAILVTKTRKHHAAEGGTGPQAGVTFTVNGVDKVTDADGHACFDNLLFGKYTVHETVPNGYVGQGDKEVTVDNKASCSDATYVGENVSFVNTPLSDITVSFNSQVPGGTAATIDCSEGSTALKASPEDSTPNAYDDTSEAFKDLKPGTYTCTVVVDP